MEEFMQKVRSAMSGRGSTGNVIAAVCSFYIPGLGQLVQGRPVMAAVQFALAFVLWFACMGWLVHLWSVIDAAMWVAPEMKNVPPNSSTSSSSSEPPKMSPPPPGAGV